MHVFIEMCVYKNNIKTIGWTINSDNVHKISDDFQILEI